MLPTPDHRLATSHPAVPPGLSAGPPRWARSAFLQWCTPCCCGLALTSSSGENLFLFCLWAVHPFPTDLWEFVLYYGYRTAV